MMCIEILAPERSRFVRIRGFVPGGATLTAWVPKSDGQAGIDETVAELVTIGGASCGC